MHTYTHTHIHRMKDISKWALMCAQDMLENRKGSCEMYGYDFMLDAGMYACVSVCVCAGMYLCVYVCRYVCVCARV